MTALTFAVIYLAANGSHFIKTYHNVFCLRFAPFHIVKTVFRERPVAIAGRNNGLVKEHKSLIHYLDICFLSNL